MKHGDQFVCPACGRTAFAKLEKVLDGWEVKGERLVCPFCGAEAGRPDSPAADDSAKAASAARKALDDLLGGGPSDDTARPSILDGSEAEERRFCRDCTHSIVNVFAVVCTRKHCEVQPMDDCPDFEKRPEPKKSSGSPLDF